MAGTLRDHLREIEDEKDRWFRERNKQAGRIKQDLEHAGRQAWNAATRARVNLVARTPQELQTLAVQQRAYNAQQAAELERRRSGGGVVAPKSAPTQPAAVAPLADRMYQGSDPDIAELRRRQDEFKKTERAISRENAWMVIPALAPVAAVMGLEGAAYIAERLAPAAVQRAPLLLERADLYLRVGDNWATRAGRRAHAALKERVAQKPEWKPEPTVKLDDGRILRPDVRTPPRVRSSGEPPKPFQMELKPNSPSGRRAAARAMKKYEDTGVKTRRDRYGARPLRQVGPLSRQAERSARRGGAQPSLVRRLPLG